MKDINPTQKSLFTTVARKRHILRVEKNLNTIGVFTPRLTRPKELSKVVSTMIRLPDGTRAEAKATITANQQFGLPITADQDKFYAFTKILDDLRNSRGRLENPVSFTYAEMLKILGRKRNGDAHREIDEWLMRMKSTVIMSAGMVWLSGRKRYSTDAFSVFDRVIGIGEELDNGDKAGRIYVYMSSWLFENFENNYVLPIDYEIYRELKFPVAKALVPLLQIWFYASRNNNRSTIEKRFPELAELLGIHRSRHLSRILQTMENSLNELKHHKLIRFWDFQPTADGKEFKLVIAPGEKFISERQAKMLYAPNSQEMAEFERLLMDLTKRGVHEETARTLLLNTADLRAARLRMEYADHEIRRRAKARSPIKNPPGFYKVLIENEAPVPATFLSETKAPANPTDVKQSYLNYRYWEAEKHFKTKYSLEEQRDQLAEAKFRFKRESDDCSYLSEEVLDTLIYHRVIQAVESEIELLSFDQYCQHNQLTLHLS